MFLVALRHGRSLRPCLGIAALALAMVGCHQRAAPPESKAPDAATPAAATTAPLAASEYFEGLTEQAFTASPAELDVLIGQAGEAAARDGKALAPTTASALARRLTEIDAARASLNRADLAIASVESYRLLVSAGPVTETAPVQVSLLDYAGFRYGADLGAQSVRWDDAGVAADFAATQWRQIEPRVTDPALRARFSAAVTGLKAAVRSQDVAAARRVDQIELDLVDELEAFFARKGG